MQPHTIPTVTSTLLWRKPYIRSSETLFSRDYQGLYVRNYEKGNNVPSYVPVSSSDKSNSVDVSHNTRGASTPFNCVSKTRSQEDAIHELKFRHGDNRKTEDIKIEEKGKEQGIRE